MDEFFILFYFFVVLVLITLVGHGIWAGLAWLFRKGRRRGDRAAYEPTLHDDRAATARYMEHLRARRLLDGETHARVMRLIAQETAPASVREGRAAEEDNRAETERREARVQALAEARRETTLPVTPAPIPIETRAAPADRGISVKFEPTPTSEPRREPEQPRPAPRRPFSEILTRFMAEKNIRWGELIGGLLILCCSVALVISLWAQIEAIPILKFLIFTVVTAALFGAGLFVQHRWKLPMTGHVLLLISALLVPLNLLAFAAFSVGEPVGGSWTIAVELLAVVLFAWLTLLAGRVVMPNAPVLFAGGIVALSTCSLVVRFLSSLTDMMLWGAALLPIGLYLLVTAVSLWRQSRIEGGPDVAAKRLLLQLGVQTFACLAPLGLVVYESGNITATMQVLAPLICAIAVPALIVSAYVGRRLASAAFPQLRTAATSITLVAAAVMLVGGGLGWPVPSRLMPALLVNGLAMIGLSRLSRHPAVHATAVVWFTAAWVLGIALVSGGVSWSANTTALMGTALLSATTGQALVAVVVACALAAGWLDRRQRHELSVGYGVTALAFLVISVGFVTWFGFAVPGDARHVAWVYAVYAAVGFAVARQLGTTLGTWGGGVLAQMAIVQALVFLWPLRQFAWPTALLIGASACAVTTVILRWTGVRRTVGQVYIGPLGQLGVAISLLAVAWMARTLSAEALAAFAIRTACFSALWISLALANRRPLMMAGSQLGFAVAICAGVQHHLSGLPWYQGLKSSLHEPYVWQAHLVAVGGLCLLWAIARAVTNRRGGWTLAENGVQHASAAHEENWVSIASRLLNPPWPAADRWLTALVLLALVFHSIWSVAPGVAAEHGWQLLLVPFSEHAHAAGVGSWILLAIMLATLVLSPADRIRGIAAFGLLVAIECAVALTAARFDAQHQVVTGLRWLWASIFLVASVAVWTRGDWLLRISRLGRGSAEQSSTPIGSMLPLLFLLFALPTIVLAATFGMAAARGEALLPAAISGIGFRFSLLGPLVLIVISLIGHGLRERQSAHAGVAAFLAIAMVAGTELCVLGRAGLVVSSTFVVWLVQLDVLVLSAVAILWRAVQELIRRNDGPMAFPSWLLLFGRAVIGVVLLCAVAALWVQPSFVPSVVVAAGTAWGFLAVLLVEGALLTTGRSVARVQEGHRVSVWALFGIVLVACALARFDAGNWLCFHAMMIGFVAAGWLRFGDGVRQARLLVGSGWQETYETAAMQAAGAAGDIGHDVSCTGCGYNLRGLSPDGRCPECNVEVGESLKAVVERLSPQWTAELARARAFAAGAILACTILGTLFALRAAFDDPQRPWWSAGALAGAGVLCMAWAGWAPRRAFAYVGGVEICLAASVWWVTTCWQTGATVASANLTNLVNINVVALAVAGIVWLWIERKMLLGRLAAAIVGRWPAFHHAAAVLTTAAITALAGMALYDAAIGQPLAGLTLPRWLAWGTASALMLACSMVPAFRRAPAGLYVLGLVAVVLAMAQSGMTPTTLAAAMSLGLGGYLVLTSVVVRAWTKARREVSAETTTRAWLLVANAVLAAVSVVLGGYVSCTNGEIAWRLLMMVSPFLCAASMVIASVSDRRIRLRASTLALLTVGGVFFAWSWIAPDAPVSLLHRAVGLFAAISVMIIVSSIAGSRTAPEHLWARAIARHVAESGAVAGVALLYCGGFEVVTLMDRHGIPLAPPAIAAMIAALALMVAACFVFAMSERYDPLRLQGTAKEGYVYLAELLVAATALHVRATMPWLFSGFITQYWPILVLGLAFTAVAGEMACKQRGLSVVARPLGRTGIFLPVLVLPEFFLASSRVHYSLVLLTVGALYAVLAALRRSGKLSAVAAAAFTASLWYLLQHTPGLGITEHPQLWFIPPALAVLAAGDLNRARLHEEHRRILHYGCLLAIYLSSSADIFLTGVARAPWLPLVLGGLSVAGILVGLASRIRSFLMLGMGFLCLSLLTIIWHASTNLGWTWAWYVAGIALGVGIITVFALFEKRRSEMNAWLEGLKRWAE
jgi:hypothetical protein